MAFPFIFVLGFDPSGLCLMSYIFKSEQVQNRLSKRRDFSRVLNNQFMHLLHHLIPFFYFILKLYRYIITCDDIANTLQTSHGLIWFPILFNILSFSHIQRKYRHEPSMMGIADAFITFEEHKQLKLYSQVVHR